MKLAWKEIRYHWRKYLLIELLLVLMIFMVMFLSGLANGLARAVSAGIENAEATYFAVSTDAEALITVSGLDPDILPQLQKKTDGKATALDIQRMNLNRKDNSEKLDVTYFAIDPDAFLNPEVAGGEKLMKEGHAIVLDQSFEEEGIAIGDIVEDSTTGIQLTVTGFTKDAMYGHTPIGFISTDTYTDIRMAINPGYEIKYHAIALQGDNLSEITVDGTQIVDKAAIIENIPGYQAEQTTIHMILWVLVVISAAVLGIFIYIITIQKRKQFGVMKAIGMQMGEITGIQLSQVFLLAGIGILCGNALAFGMSQMLPSSMPFYLQPEDAAVVSLSFVVISMICSLISAVHVAKIDPIIIIGGNEE